MSSSFTPSHAAGIVFSAVSSAYSLLAGVADLLDDIDVGHEVHLQRLLQREVLVRLDGLPEVLPRVSPSAGPACPGRAAKG